MLPPLDRLLVVTYIPDMGDTINEFYRFGGPDWLSLKVSAALLAPFAVFVVIALVREAIAARKTRR